METPNAQLPALPPLGPPLPDRRRMNGKPVGWVASKSVINFESAFDEKLLCDGLTFSTGLSCAYGCRFCYVSSMLRKSELVQDALEALGEKFADAVLRRKDALQILERQLLDAKGRRRFADPNDRRVIFASPLVDVAANMDLVRETVAACLLILKLTNWTIRLLSKSTLLPKIAAEIPSVWRSRVIYGVSTGTLDDGIARAVEAGTPLVSRRIASLHELQDAGLRTYGMVCPSLPQANAEDYDSFSAEAMRQLRSERLEHVWAEPINVRGESLLLTEGALRDAGFSREATLLAAVSGDTDRWETYARATFEAHARHVPAGKLRFLQYPTKKSLAWWTDQRSRGAVLLGKIAHPVEAPAP